MNQVQTFKFDSAADIRIVPGPDGSPWWVAADVCRVLEHSDTSKAVSRLDPEERGTSTVRTPSGDQGMLVISESGLYDLVLTSRKPEARRFARWVRREVLPAIRRTGRYQVAPATAPSPADIEAEEAADPLLQFLARTGDLLRAQVEQRRATLEVRRRVDEVEVLAIQAQADAQLALTTLHDDTRYVSLVGYSATHKLGLDGRELAAEGKKITRHCRERGIEIKSVPCEKRGRKHTYPVDLLDGWAWSAGAPAARPALSIAAPAAG